MLLTNGNDPACKVTHITDKLIEGDLLVACLMLLKLPSSYSSWPVVHVTQTADYTQIILPFHFDTLEYPSDARDPLGLEGVQ